MEGPPVGIWDDGMHYDGSGGFALCWASGFRWKCRAYCFPSLDFSPQLVGTVLWDILPRPA